MTREALKLPRASPRMSSGRFATFAKGRSHFPFWPKIEPKLGVHRYLMKDFPYAIPFIIEPASIHIIAFAHCVGGRVTGCGASNREGTRQDRLLAWRSRSTGTTFLA